MTRSQTIGLTLFGWSVVSLFWLVATRDFHPTKTLAIVVTCTLMLAYAAAAYVHHLYLIPKYFQTRRFVVHACLLLSTMVLLTAAALAIIRVSYLYIFGPYPVNYWYIDYALDFFGMAVHLVLAMVVLSLFKRYAV